METHQKTVIDSINKADRILLTTHFRPDGDAVGSITGLGRALSIKGLDVHIVMKDPPGDRFAYMADGLSIDSIENLKPPYDYVVTLDCGDFDRTGYTELLQNLKIPIINIDHHASNPSFGDINYVDTDASSTSEMVFGIIDEGGWPLNRDIARSLYSGICTDTRFFQIPSVSPGTFKCLARLLETGLDTEPILAILKDNKSFVDLKILARGLAKARTEMDGLLIWTHLTLKDLAELDAVSRNAWSSGLFNSLNSLGTALACVSFIELEGGGVSGEYRSKRGFNVQEIATRFGGGGHIQASGCRLSGPQMIKDVLTVMREALILREAE